MNATPHLMADQDGELSAVLRRERSRLGRFIRRRVPDAADAEDILHDVFHEFVDAYRLPAPIEQASAWLFRVARNRIIDRFRRARHDPLQQRAIGAADAGEETEELAPQLDLALPAIGGGPEAEYTRSALLFALQQAIGELPPEQREVFLAHELEGRSFKEMARHSGLPVNTLLARKRYAVLQLRRRLQSVYDDLEI